MQRIPSSYIYQHLSTGEPTYWTTDPRQQPYLDFYIVDIYIKYPVLKAESNFDMSIDHSAVLLTQT